MEDIGFGIGVLLVLIGPVLILLLIWIVYRLLLRLNAMRESSSDDRDRRTILAFSIGLVFVTLIVSYIPGRIEYSKLCKAHGQPSVRDSVLVDGFFRTKLHVYEARNYLDAGFGFVEAPHPYKDSLFVRYALSKDGVLEETESSTFESMYAVDVQFDEPSSGLTYTRKTVYEIATGRLLADASSIHYQGGPLSIFFGTYAMSSCPDPRSATGSGDFQRFYELERRVLIATQS